MNAVVDQPKRPFPGAATFQNPRVRRSISIHRTIRSGLRRRMNCLADNRCQLWRVRTEFLAHILAFATKESANAMSDRFDRGALKRLDIADNRRLRIDAARQRYRVEQDLQSCRNLFG